VLLLFLTDLLPFHLWKESLMMHTRRHYLRIMLYWVMCKCAITCLLHQTKEQLLYKLRVAIVVIVYVYRGDITNLCFSIVIVIYCCESYPKFPLIHLKRRVCVWVCFVDENSFSIICLDLSYYYYIASWAAWASRVRLISAFIPFNFWDYLQFLNMNLHENTPDSS